MKETGSVLQLVGTDDNYYLYLIEPAMQSTCRRCGRVLPVHNSECLTARAPATATPYRYPAQVAKPPRSHVPTPFHPIALSLTISLSIVGLLGAAIFLVSLIIAAAAPSSLSPWMPVVGGLLFGVDAIARALCQSVRKALARCGAVFDRPQPMGRKVECVTR